MLCWVLDEIFKGFNIFHFIINNSVWRQTWLIPGYWLNWIEIDWFVTNFQVIQIIYVTHMVILTWHSAQSFLKRKLLQSIHKKQKKTPTNNVLWQKNIKIKHNNCLWGFSSTSLATITLYWFSHAPPNIIFFLHQPINILKIVLYCWTYDGDCFVVKKLYFYIFI